MASMEKRHYVAISAVAFTIFLVAFIAILVIVIDDRNCPNGTEEQPSSAPDGDSPRYPSSFGEYRYGAVASDAATCSQVGTDILGRRGGTAVDAVIATMLCDGLVNMHSLGIGGGHFANVYATPRESTTKEAVTVLARETAPAAATENMFVDNLDASTVGGLAIAVPGEVMGFWILWEKFGRVPWADLVQPTIRLAKHGFVVPYSLASAAAKHEDFIRADPFLSEILLHPDGSLLREGDTAYDQKLAVTLEKIAADPHTFYTGDLAKDIVADIAEMGGIITLDDLRNYEAKIKAPLRTTLRNGDYTVLGVKPPSSGAVIQYILKLLDGYGFNNSSIANLESTTLTYHRIIEAFKHSSAGRSALGDEDFVDVDEILANMASDANIEATRLRINDSFTQEVTYYDPVFTYLEDRGTAHVSILAPGNSAVSMTNTINRYFGCKRRGNRTGIIFNNEMEDFSTPNTTSGYGVPASKSNFIEPGKMPMSSMSPIIVLNDNNVPVLITGASGGTKITTQTAWVTMHTLWFGQRIDRATSTPRMHHQLVPNEIVYEQDVDENILKNLRGKKHVTTLSPAFIAVVGSIHNTCKPCTGDICRHDKPCIHAASDGRKRGAPDGF